tara:strand:- start:202 stop:681 length:480 start_codon:yes stop_codon:yes gene_type:complete
MDQYNTNNDWSLWYHSINDNNWKNSSYKKMLDINNFFDYKFIVDNFKQNHYQNGMFFCMKDDIFPTWEDPNNRQGGCLSFKVYSKNIVNEWDTLLLKCITNSILKNKKNIINGISISPKKEFNIVKVWFSENSEEYKDNFIEFGNDFNLSTSVYKKHEI